MTLYDLIADLRREHQSEAASRTLDTVMLELGRTRDNLRSAVAAIDTAALPAGGQEIVRELVSRAEKARLDNLDFGEKPHLKGFQPPLEPAEDGMKGVAVLLGLTSLTLLVLAGAAVAAGVSRIFH